MNNTVTCTICLCTLFLRGLCIVHVIVQQYYLLLIISFIPICKVVLSCLTCTTFWNAFTVWLLLKLLATFWMVIKYLICARKKLLSNICTKNLQILTFWCPHTDVLAHNRFWIFNTTNIPQKCIGYELLVSRQGVECEWNYCFYQIPNTE